MGSWRVLALMALRNLWSHRVKSVIVGLIMAFGTFLLVLGTAMLDSVEGSMARSIISSLSGHLQVYDAEAGDELSLFGNLNTQTPDLGEIEDFSTVRGPLLEVPGVKAVVPMGLGIAVVSAAGDFDRALQELEAALRSKDPVALDEARAQMRQILEVMAQERAQRAQISDHKEEGEEALERARSEAFWEEFGRDPEAGVRFLEGKVAPLAAQGRLLYMRYLGTDLALFAESFDRFEVVRGEVVPPGTVGMLVSERFLEKQAKHKVARDLDAIKELVDQGVSIDAIPAIQDMVRRNARQYRQIVFQLSARDTRALTEALKGLMPGAEGSISALLEQFLTVSDGNIQERYRFFYEEIAPRIQLYSVSVGDVVTLRTVARTGYLRAANVKIYGSYQFKGMESSDLAGATNLVDLVTFRQLYGQFTLAQQEEMAEIREDVGVKEVSRDAAEAELFGGGAVVEEAAAPKGGFDEFAGGAGSSAGERSERYDPAEARQGLAISAAVLLEDPERLEEARAAIEALSKERGLGIQVVDWQEAAGLVGQFILVTRLVLYVSIFIIFLVALVIINNSMIMATMERVAEIGTMRAIGAGRGFVLGLFLVETTLLGLLAGGAGALAGAGFVGVLGQVGVPSGGQPFLVFLFSGPRLFPEVGLGHLGVALGVILAVTLVATLYPARLATRIAPVVAMQRKE
jgi:ABC-type lipoprotein release transport system permease subunit